METLSNAGRTTIMENAIVDVTAEMPPAVLKKHSVCDDEIVVNGKAEVGQVCIADSVSLSGGVQENNTVVSVNVDGLQPVQEGANECDTTNPHTNEATISEEKCRKAMNDVFSSVLQHDSTKDQKQVVAADTPTIRRKSVFSNVILEDGLTGDKKDIEKCKDIKKASSGEMDNGEKSRILRNLFLLSFSYFVLFTAFKGAGNLQSSINMEGGLGTSSLMAYYGAFIVSSIFLPVLMIQRIGCKWTIAISALLYAPYMGAQFLAEFSTLIPGALSAGLGAGPIWCALCTYILVVAEVYSRLVGSSTEAATNRFYGIFYMIYQLSQVSGNLISSLVLSTGGGPPHNETFLEDNLELEESMVCGSTFCPGGQDAGNPNLVRPPEEKINILAWIYLACVLVAAAIIAVAIDSLNRYDGGTRSTAAKQSGLSLLAVTFKLMKHPYQLLLMPVSIFFGMEKAFLGAEYTAVYVSCAVGIHNIGYTMICYGVTNSLSSFLTSSLVRLVGRKMVVASTVVLHLALLLALLLWAPNKTDTSLMYVLAAVWGVLDAVWLVQLNTLTGLLFPGNEEAAYSNYHLWESLGYILCYGWSNLLCTDVKLYIILSFLVVGAAGYAVIEWSEGRKKTKE